MSRLGRLWGGRGLDKIWVVRRWNGVLLSLERRDRELRGKATAKALTQRARRLRKGRGGRTASLEFCNPCSLIPNP